ncbi:signal peptidase I [Conexibacter sp. SYSU D00693]|uniref:signal peptidase I n=1 Tax=Conexibacter sp. SYSU D00693 TaxID=2812560 RepID=UPI00196A70E7|nr:signal peptidase I [Conexibacter sp. SYSU D00693]
MTLAGRIAGVLVPLTALALAVVLLGPALFGMERYVLTSGSMTGSYDRGSVVFGDPTPRDQLRAGDVVTFQPPGHTELVTHRITEVVRTPGAPLAFRTKGDANDVADPWTFTPTTAELPRVVGSVPHVGYVVAALDVRWVRTLVIGLPAALLALALIAGLWRDSSPGRIRFEVTA